MSQHRVDKLVHSAFWYILSGAFVIVCGTMVPRDPAKPLPMVFTGLSLAMIGVYGGALRGWKSERGLWMLASLMLSVHGTFWLYLEYRSFASVFEQPIKQRNGLNWQEMLYIADSTIALIVFGVAIRLAASIACYNWRVSFPK